MTNNKDRKLILYVIAFLPHFRKLHEEIEKIREYCYPVIENGFLGLYKCEIDNEEKLEDLDKFFDVDEKAVEEYLEHFPTMKELISLHIGFYTWIINGEELSKEDVLKLYEKILEKMMETKIFG